MINCLSVVIITICLFCWGSHCHLILFSLILVFYTPKHFHTLSALFLGPRHTVN